MIENILYIILGLGVLVIAGDLLVRGAVGLGSLLGIPTLLISLTVVAFGTSAPELVVTLQDVLTGAPGENGIAMGNIIGSNIANILLVLGLPAIIYPIALNLQGLKRHAVVMIFATLAFAFFAYFYKTIDIRAGLVLFGMIVAYIIYMATRAIKAGADEPVLDDLEEYSETNGKAWKTPAFLLVGLVGLPFGAQLLVTNGSVLASTLGVSDVLIGLTIVAFGTSLPELATVFAAALKKQADVAVGNVVGSNIFNLLFVGGAAGLAGTSEITDQSRWNNIPIMMAATLLLAVMIFMGAKISRPVGIAFLVGYVGFIAFLGFSSH